MTSPRVSNLTWECVSQICYSNCHICYGLMISSELVNSSSPDLQQQINNLGNYCSKWQLVVNMLKTKRLVFGNKGDILQYFNFKGEPIEIATDYIYLGNPMYSTGNPFGKLADHVIQKCIRACYKIREYCKPLGQVPPFHALHFYNTLLPPYMDYG